MRDSNICLDLDDISHEHETPENNLNGALGLQ